MYNNLNNIKLGMSFNLVGFSYYTAGISFQETGDNEAVAAETKIVAQLIPPAIDGSVVGTCKYSTLLSSRLLKT